MKGIVLALGGGGVRGAAHTGVLEVLSEAKIPIAGIAGSSAGAVAGAMHVFESWVPIEELNAWLQDPEFERLRKNGVLHQVVRMVEFVRKPYLAEGGRIRDGYKRVFGSTRIEDSPIPFVIQATDINTGEAVIIRAGLVAEALAASSAIPSILPPVIWHGRTLIDGDVVEKVPATAARALGLGPVVAVDVSNIPVPVDPKTALDTLLQAGEASRRRLLTIALQNADLLINLSPPTPIDTFDTTRSREAYELGRIRTQEALPQIRKLLEEPVDPWWAKLLPPKSLVKTPKTQTIAAQTQQGKPAPTEVHALGKNSQG
jgi:NTE family protein